MKYIDFNKDEQIIFMRTVKKNSKLTWDTIAQRLGISRPMIFFYLSAKSKILIDNYNKLCILGKINPSAKKYIEIKNKAQKIRIVNKMNSSLAELLGILAGDGHISRINYEISVTCHLTLDAEYVRNHVLSLFIRLFEVNAKIKTYEAHNVIRCVVNSKMLHAWITKEYNLPIGKKKGRLHIPEQVTNKNEWLRAYIRGLFDTDGSVYLRRKKSVVVSIISRDPVFLEEVKWALEKLGHKTSVSGKNLYIYDQKQITTFFSEVKPANKKHLQRYNKFINEITVR